uniref:Serpentine receptor class gamma n=1 Tax=Parastrongyloides trichosuri TaxID=131310 RepID=A0A0N4ZXL7_PARTI
MIQVGAIIFFQKFPHWRFFLDFIEAHDVFNHMVAPLICMAPFASVLGCTFTVINRYCALCYPLLFKEKWSKNVSCILIVIQIILPVAIFSFNFGNSSKLVYVEVFDSYMFQVLNLKDAIINNIILFCLTFLSTVITVTLNFIIFKKFKKLMANASKKERNKKYLMMFYMIGTTLCLIALCLFIITKFRNGAIFTTFLLYWIIPTLTLVQPITTLIMSKYIRESFLRFYFNNFIFKNYLKNRNNVTSINTTKKH